MFPDEADEDAKELFEEDDEKRFEGGMSRLLCEVGNEI
jgi:hypothetical protein